MSWRKEGIGLFPLEKFEFLFLAKPVTHTHQYSIYFRRNAKMPRNYEYLTDKQSDRDARAEWEEYITAERRQTQQKKLKTVFPLKMPSAITNPWRRR
jgi:hypothetical protein